MRSRTLDARRTRGVSAEDRFDIAFSRLFTFLTPDETAAVLARAEFVERGADEFILHEGAPCKALYVIVNGEAAVMKRTHLGPGRDQTVELARVGLGSVVGEMAFLEHDLASASVVAQRPTQLYRIDRDAVLDLIDASPDFAANFYRSLAIILSRRLRLANMVMSSATAPATAKRKDHYKIVVVDDDPDILQFVSLFLEHSGHTVLTTTNPIEALSEITSFRPDLVITDLMMTGMDGLVLCEEIRKRAALDKTKIIMISVWSESAWTEKALDAGANGFIMKALNPETFAMQIERIMLAA